jgi:peptidyl-prolyl cis-trans isomerase C
MEGAMPISFFKRLLNPFKRKRSSNMSESTTQFVEVRASHLLVGTEAEAAKCREEVLEGKTFAEVAKSVSKCPSGAQGGDLGYFTRGRMVPQFDTVAFTLPVGELSPPVQTQFGWHILTVTDRR